MIRKTWLICLFAILAVSQLVLGCATEDKHMDISKKVLSIVLRKFFQTF